MGVFLSSFGRWLFHLVFFALSLIISCPGYSLDFQEDSFYHKVNRNEWIRTADSLFVYNDDYLGAEKLYIQALERLDLSREELRAYCMIKLGNVYTSMSEFDKAKENFYNSEKLIKKLNNHNSSLVGEYDLYYGKYLKRTFQDMDSAEYYIEQSIRIRKNQLAENQEFEDSLRMAESLYFQAEIFKDQAFYFKAEELYREVQEIYENILEKDNILLGRLYSSLATCLRFEFDFKNAIDYGERAIQIFQQDSLNNLNRLASSMIYNSNTYIFQEDYARSIPLTKRLLNMIKNNKGLDRFLIYVYWNLANAYTYLNKFDMAQFYLNESYNILDDYYVNNEEYQAYTYFLNGEFYLKKNDFIRSRENFLDALNIYQSQLNFNLESQSYCFEYIGDTYYESNNLDTSLYCYQKALILLLDNFHDDNIYSNPEIYDDPDKMKIFDVLHKKAKAWKKYYDLEGNLRYLKEALSIYNLIDRLNDQARNSKLKDASLLIISDFYHDGYEMALDCAWDLYRQTQDKQYLEQAFQLMEKSKSMLLFKSLVQAERSKSINLPYSIKQREDSLRMLNVEYEQKIGQENNKESPDPDVLSSLESEKFRVIREIENLREEISDKFPSYYQIRYDSLTKDLGNFQRYCNGNGLTGIEYYWGNQAIYLVATNGSTTNFIRITRNEESDHAFHTLLIQLSHGTRIDRLEDDYRNYIRDAYLGYQYLLGGLDPAILRNQRLLIIPDGNLAQLPFEALLVQPEEPGSVDYRNLHYLILDKSISYSYSYNFLQNSRQTVRKSSKENTLLAFSYSDISDFSEDNPRAADESELFYSSQELNTIKKIIPKNSRFFYGQEATENQFKKLAPDYELIHLAVHGYADTLDGDNSRLIFKKGNDPEDDSILYMHELYGLDLSKTDLAVLSACESGIGEEFRGEGVFSMARGFFYAGCPSIIMSLWRVSDKYSAELMGEFYQYLKKGGNASSALRQSKLDFIKKQDKYNTHPVNWASFVYLGEEFQYEKQSINLILISLIFIVVVSGIYFMFRLRRS